MAKRIAIYAISSEQAIFRCSILFIISQRCMLLLDRHSDHVIVPGANSARFQDVYQLFQRATAPFIFISSPETTPLLLHRRTPERQRYRILQQRLDAAEAPTSRRRLQGLSPPQVKGIVPQTAARISRSQMTCSVMEFVLRALPVSNAASLATTMLSPKSRA